MLSITFGLLLAILPAALAQSSSPSYTTITTYDPCTNMPMSTATITATTTIEVCPVCTEQPNSGASVTIYETVYEDICPTGGTVISGTFTITENCAGGCNGGVGWIPAGFTATVKPCSCGMSSSTTVTVPCGCTNTGSWASATESSGGKTSNCVYGTDLTDLRCRRSGRRG